MTQFTDIFSMVTNLITFNFNGLSQTFGIDESIIKILIALTIIPFISVTILKFTGNFTLTLFASAGLIITTAIFGLIPLWIAGIFGLFGVASITYRIFLSDDIPIPTNNSNHHYKNSKTRDGALNVPNQLIQKKYKQEIIIGIDNIQLKAIDSVEITQKLAISLKQLEFDKGIRTLNNLKTEITEINNIFSNSLSNNNFIDINKTRKTVEEIYNKSLKFLSLAIDIYKQLKITNNDNNLQIENNELLESLKNCKEGTTSYKILKEALDKNTNIINLVKQNKDRIDELFGQISLCKDALTEIRLSLPELLNHQSTDELDKTILESKDRINFGQRLLDEYKVQGL